MVLSVFLLHGTYKSECITVFVLFSSNVIVASQPQVRGGELSELCEPWRAAEKPRRLPENRENSSVMQLEY